MVTVCFAIVFPFAHGDEDPFAAPVTAQANRPLQENRSLAFLSTLRPRFPARWGHGVSKKLKHPAVAERIRLDALQIQELGDTLVG